MMADLITSQVHSTHAFTLVATEKKVAKQQRQDRGGWEYCRVATAMQFFIFLTKSTTKHQHMLKTVLLKQTPYFIKKIKYLKMYLVIKLGSK